MQNRSRLVGIEYLTMMAVWLISGLVISLTGLDRHMNYYSSHAFVEMAFLIPVVVMLVIDRFEQMRGTRMKVINWRVILWTMLIALLLLPVTNFLNMTSQLFVPNHVATEVDSFTLLTGASVWDKPLWLNLLYMAVLPAVVEEFIFRGVLFQGLRSCGLFKTAFLTALMFGLTHANLNQFLYAFVLGLILAYLVEASGSVYSSMLVHALINSVTIVAVYLERLLPENVASAMVEAENTSVRDLSPIYWVLTGAIAVACIVLAVIVIRTIARTAGRENIYLTARKGRDRLKGKEGKTFSVELLIGLMIPTIYIAIMLIVQLVRH